MRQAEGSNGRLGAVDVAKQADNKMASVQSPIQANVHETKEGSVGSGRELLCEQTFSGPNVSFEVAAGPDGHGRV